MYSKYTNTYHLQRQLVQRIRISNSNYKVQKGAKLEICNFG